MSQFSSSGAMLLGGSRDFDGYRTPDLGVGGEALSINSASQVVGEADGCAGDGSHAVLQVRGGPTIDLNTVIPQGSGVALTPASGINDRGEIAAQGVPANGQEHAFLSIPLQIVR